MKGKGLGGDATAQTFVPDAETVEYVATVRALMVEHDLERARLRGRIYQLEQIIAGAGLTPLADDGSGMASAYHDQLRATKAVLDYFGVGPLGLDGLPAELYDAFRPLVIT